MVQLNLTGEVLSNEERVDFQPFAREPHAPLTRGRRREERSARRSSGCRSSCQRAAGRFRGRTRQRRSARDDFTNFRIDPADYETRLAEAAESDARMVRETRPKGLRYLEKNADRRARRQRRLRLLAHVPPRRHSSRCRAAISGRSARRHRLLQLRSSAHRHPDECLLRGRGPRRERHESERRQHAHEHRRRLFRHRPADDAVALSQRDRAQGRGREVAATVADRSAPAIRSCSSARSTSRSASRTSLTAARTTRRRPSSCRPSTFVISPSVDAQYARWGGGVTGFYDYNQRTSWKPWGNLAEYDPKQKSFTDFGGSLGKSFYLPKFQRIGVEVNYLDGTHLDRFSKYELGFFGTQRIHGIRSGSVRAEKMILGHLTYGFVFSDQFRLEAFYDHGLIDDKTRRLSPRAVPGPRHRRPDGRPVGNAAAARHRQDDRAERAERVRGECGVAEVVLGSAPSAQCLVLSAQCLVLHGEKLSS